MILRMGETTGGRIHIVTGPKSSGKSVYMKQVGLIVYLAHVGCWVPAAAARIPLTDKLFTRIQTVESVSLGLSSFLCDVNQVGGGDHTHKQAARFLRKSEWPEELR